jgi:hypothetical protein
MPGNCREAQDGGIEISKQDARKKVLKETGGHVNIEARLPQKIGEREAGGRGEIRNLDIDPK